MKDELITEEDIAQMTHDTQVWKFGFCVCSDCESGNG
jgi:hypothetical protein